MPSQTDPQQEIAALQAQLAAVPAKDIVKLLGLAYFAQTSCQLDLTDSMRAHLEKVRSWLWAFAPEVFNE